MRRLSALLAVGVLALAGCGGGSGETTTGKEVATPQELTDAFGRIAGVCIAATSFGQSLDASQIAKIRADLEVLTDSAAVDPEAPTADAGYNVKDGLFDLVGQMKGCDPGLEAQLQHAIDTLP